MRKTIERMREIVLSTKRYTKMSFDFFHFMKLFYDLNISHRIRSSCDDPFIGIDERLHLANSYIHTSLELRRTWIESVVAIHSQNSDWAEAAIACSHLVGIILQQMRRMSQINVNSINTAFVELKKVSEEVCVDCNEFQDEEENVNPVTLKSNLERVCDECVELLMRAELFEVLLRMIYYSLF